MNQLKKIRTLKEMSQFDLRIATGIHQSRISLMENDYVVPRDDEKKKIAKVLKTSVKALFPAKRKGLTILTGCEGSNEKI